MKTTTTTIDKAAAIFTYVISNEKCDNAQIAADLKLGKESVRLILLKLVDEGKIAFEVVGNNKKKIFVAVKQKPAKAKTTVARVKTPKVPTVKASIQTVLLTKKKKERTPAIVQTKFGLGLIYDNEPTVVVKKNMYHFEKIIVHLVKDNMEPRLMNGKPKKILTTMDKVTMVTPSKEIVKARAKREKGAPGVSNKNFDKYKFGKTVYSKGRLVHAVIAKFVEDNNPTLAELNIAFPEAVIQPLCKALFLPVDAAKVANEKRTRFFAKDEEVIKIKGGKIAVSNQIDGALVNRLLTVTEKLGYKITLEATV
jgi:hypothetical protein